MSRKSFGILFVVLISAVVAMTPQAVAASVSGTGKGEGAVPGETLGTIVLQRDTENQILLLDQVMFPDCDTRRIVNTEVLEVSDETRNVKGRTVAANWKERWSMDRCGEIIPYEITYVPDGKGGTQIQIETSVDTTSAKTEAQFAIWHYQDTSQGAVVFEIAEEKVTFLANDYGPALKPNPWVENVVKFWGQVKLVGDRKRAFILLRRGDNPEGSVWYEKDIYEFSLDEYLKRPDVYKLRQIELKTALEKTRIHEICSSSESGDYLLVTASYTGIGGAGAQPLILVTKTGKLREVTPWKY